MNIFVLDLDPKKCAEYHCDKHVIKMILETAQLLSTVCRYYDIDHGYKLTHKNHPCSIWLRESYQNVVWLWKLGIELCHEYERRYKKVHKSFGVIQFTPLDDLYKIYENKTEMTSFKLAMPDQYKTENPVESYKLYYLNEKKDIAKWKHSQIPEWWS
jgi:hypothetical protein